MCVLWLVEGFTVTHTSRDTTNHRLFTPSNLICMYISERQNMLVNQNLQVYNIICKLCQIVEELGIVIVQSSEPCKSCMYLYVSSVFKYCKYYTIVETLCMLWAKQIYKPLICLWYHVSKYYICNVNIYEWKNKHFNLPMPNRKWKVPGRRHCLHTYGVKGWCSVYWIILIIGLYPVGQEQRAGIDAG